MRPRTPAAVFWRRMLSGPSADSRMLAYSEFRSVLGAGIPLAEALQSASVRASGAMSALFREAAAAVAAGESPAPALRSRPETLPAAETEVIATGERHGRWDLAFAAAEAQATRSQRAFRSVASALAYPVFLVHVAFLVPLPFVISVGGGWITSIAFWGACLAVLWIAAALVVSLHVNRRSAPAWSRRIASLPLAGDAARRAANARFCETASALADAIERAGACAASGWIEDGATRAARRMREGGSAADAMLLIESLPPEAPSLLRSGDTAGDLADALRRLAQLESDRAETSLRRTAIALRSVFFVVIVVAVAWMYVRTVGGYYSQIESIMGR